MGWLMLDSPLLPPRFFCVYWVMAVLSLDSSSSGFVLFIHYLTMVGCLTQVSRPSLDPGGGPRSLPRELPGGVPPKPPRLPLVVEEGDYRKQGRGAYRRAAPGLPGELHGGTVSGLHTLFVNQLCDITYVRDTAQEILCTRYFGRESHFFGPRHTFVLHGHARRDKPSPVPAPGSHII